MTLVTSEDWCPDCRTRLIQPEKGQPWCPACEWNLRTYDPEIVPARGWRSLDRWGHRLATRMDRALYARFSAERPSRPGWTVARAVLTAVSALLKVLVLGCLLLGLWLIVHWFPSWFVVPGILLVLLAVGLRPRLGRPPRRGILRRDHAPVLFDLVDRVAAAAGARPPAILAVEPMFNASMQQVGLRRRAVLTLGTPLWITLEADQRVALVAHELGHTINGDPNRGLLIEPALNTFRMLAVATGASRSLGDALQRPHFMLLAAELVVWAVSRVFLLVHVGLSALALRDHQRAEYLADAVAADVAGTRAAVSMLDRLVLLPSIATLIGYNATTTPPERWTAMANSFAASRGDHLRALRQLTERDTSLWYSHPPEGLRARMIEAWPSRQPLVTLSDEDSRRIDQELAGWYAATHRRILGTRDYRELPSRQPAER